MTMQFKVLAGNHDRRSAFVSIPLEQPSTGGRLTHERGDEVPCQVDAGRLWLRVDRLAAGASAGYTFEPDAPATRRRGVRFRHDEAQGTVDVTVGTRRFTTYHYHTLPDTDSPRPYFFPIIGPSGASMTRAYPMQTLDGENHDHKHHRSVWVAHGDLNGCDLWTEEPGHGVQVHREFVEVEGGPLWGRLVERLTWEDAERQPIINESRTVAFYATSDPIRIVDLTVHFTADHGPVSFGDTKEGGICSIRIATTMDGNKGGRIVSSVGGVGETECWGRPAHWIDYSGQAEDQHVGVAIFDHPMNLRSPTPWHVRDYGLFSANPFGHGDYQQSLLTNGTHVVEAGASLTFRYRMLWHKADERKANVGGHYHNWVNPPAVES